MKQLPNLPGDTHSEAIAVTNSGVVIGNGTSADGRHPVIWGTDGSVRTPGQLDGRDTRAVAANDSEVIVGIALDPFRAWIYDPDVGHIEELPVPSGASASEATAINDKGEIVGVIGFLTGSRAVRWEPKTYAFSYLPVLGFPTIITLGDINENGTIVGTYNGRPTDLAIEHRTADVPTYGNMGRRPCTRDQRRWNRRRQSSSPSDHAGLRRRRHL